MKKMQDMKSVIDLQGRYESNDPDRPLGDEAIHYLIEEFNAVVVDDDDPEVVAG